MVKRKEIPRNSRLHILATLHKFEGWSDVLLGKAAGGDVLGLQTIQAGVAHKAASELLPLTTLHSHLLKIAWITVSEIDLVFKRPLDEKTSVLKAALYSKGDDFGQDDVTKAWLMLNHKIL